MKCSIDGCSRAVLSRGWCEAHYARWRATGDVRADTPIMCGSRDERFWAKVNKGVGCWLWNGHIDKKGYGKTSSGHGAHREAYLIDGREIPDGMELDHLCRNRACVNPSHLEPVEHAENVRRGRSGKLNSEKTHCRHGHPYSGENLYVKPSGERCCRTCRRTQDLKARNWVLEAIQMMQQEPVQ